MEKITKGESSSNDVIVNRTLITAAFQINNGYKIVAEAEAELVCILNYTATMLIVICIGLIKQRWRMTLPNTELSQGSSLEIFIDSSWINWIFLKKTQLRKLQAIEKLENLVENNVRTNFNSYILPNSASSAKIRSSSPLILILSCLGSKNVKFKISSKSVSHKLICFRII